MSKNSSVASIELWLVSNSSYRQDRKKQKKNCNLYMILTGKNFKIVCRNKVLLVFKNVQNLFFTPKFLLSIFRLMSLVSHHAAFLERLFYKKNSALFLVFCGELFPIVFIQTHAHSISINFTWLEIILLCPNTVLLPPSNGGGSQTHATDQTEKRKRKIAICLWFSQVKISKLCGERNFYWFSKMYRTCFLHQDFFSLSLD